jgi:HD-GYP domain-containing protein (c-di-GMP phosphodiesterase class II)
VGTFTKQERKLWQVHPQLGSKVVGDADMFSHAVNRIVSEHHERVDGSGYPWGKSGAQIFSLAQLVGLVDRYDALISSRGQRPATPPALAVRRIYQLGIQGEFAMDWVERLIRCVSIYPIGSLVELNTGERGWVVSVNSTDRMCPTVKLLWNKKHQKMSKPITIEIAGLQDHSPERKIQRVLNPKIEGVTEEFSCLL